MSGPPRARPRRRALATLVTIAAVLGALLASPALPAAATPGLTATFSTADNGSWWLGKYVIHNDSDAAVNGWTLEFDLPPGVTMSLSWNGQATVSGDGHVSVEAAYYNATVAAHSTTEPYSFTMVLSGPGEPTGCRLNDASCDGDADQPPGAPTNLRATATTTTTVSLAWDAASGGDFPVTGYEVLRNGEPAATVSGTTATVTGLEPATSYTFTVVAVDSAGNRSPESAPLTVSTRDPADDEVPPSAPANLRVTATTSNSVSLAWDAASDNVGVVAYDVFNGTELATTVTGTAATVTGLQPATTYTFTVEARDGSDNRSPASNPVTATTEETADPGSFVRVGYFAQWGIYGRQYFVKNLETTGAADRLTHINYAFTNLDPVNLTCLNGVVKGVSPNPQDPDQGTGAGDAEADYSRAFSAAQSVDGVGDTFDQALRGNFNQLRKLKQRHPHLKVLMSLGGWTYSKFFSDAAATAASRERLVSSCIDMYIRGNLPPFNGAGGPGSAAGVFDGIDIDWEWPGAEGHPGNHISPNDKENLVLLLAEFRRQLDELGAETGEHYLLTAFTPADPAKIDAGWDLSRIFDHLDFANVQGYDFHGAGSDNSWEPNRTGHQANVFTDVDDPYPFHFSVDEALQVYLDAGVNPRQLTIGIPFYGRGWQQVADGGVSGEWQSAGGAAPGQFPEEAGTRGYSNLIASVPNMTIVHDEQAIATFGYTGNNGQWWTFDDPWSLGRKMTYVRDQNLLGVMIWEMSGDTGTLMGAIDAGLD